MMGKRISWFGQVKVYAGKCFRIFLSEKQWKNFISSLIIILIISLVTGDEMFSGYRDTKNGIFAIVSACIWIGLFNSIRSICKERAIIKREHRTGLHISAYISAHVVYEFVVCWVETLIVVIVTFIKNHDHLPDDGLVMPMFMDVFTLLFLVILSSDMIAIMLSCIVKDENMAMTVMPFILIIQLVMSGNVFDLSGVSEWISYITISRWGMNGLLAIANTDPEVELGYVTLGNGGADPEFSTLMGVYGVLVLFCVVYVAIGILFLKLVDKDKR